MNIIRLHSLVHDLKRNIFLEVKNLYTIETDR